MEYIIKSKRFVLRPIRKSDKKSLIENINDRTIYRHTLRIPYPYTSKDADKWIRHCLYIRNKKKLTEINFVIDIDGEVAGTTGFVDIKGHSAETGYWIAKKHRNKGIGAEVLKAVTDFGFRRLRLKRIYAVVFKGNRASARILDKNGYRLEGTLRKYRMKDRKLIDVWMYAKVR